MIVDYRPTRDALAASAAAVPVKDGALLIEAILLVRLGHAAPTAVANLTATRGRKDGIGAVEEVCPLLAIII